MSETQTDNTNKSNLLDYVICCIGAFAERFSISNTQAYRYLNHYQGLDFLKKHYEIEHTFSVDDVVDDLTTVCQHNGGDIANLKKVETI